MRLPVDRRPIFRRLAQACLVLTTSTALAACTSASGGSPDYAASALPANGPQADYPVTIGEPYTIGDRAYRPADVLNYDEVGYLAAGTGVGYTAAHHTLPFPSYVEVTSLETGRTVLVRVEQRGPMDTDHLLALSPAAMAQLGAAPGTPVRVRRVNAPEAQRALLRDGQAAPLRMDTPMGLVEVLRRRLPSEGSASLATSQPVAASEAQVAAPPEEAAAESSENDAGNSFADAFDVATPTESEAETPGELAVASTAADGFKVQAATFSTEERAQNAAAALGGHVEPSGQYFRVRTGPYASREDAEASLANVRAAGYNDARILIPGQG